MSSRTVLQGSINLLANTKFVQNRDVPIQCPIVNQSRLQIALNIGTLIKDSLTNSIKKIKYFLTSNVRYIFYELYTVD